MKYYIIAFLNDGEECIADIFAYSFSQALFLLNINASDVLYHEECVRISV